jgi:hypothetical protein
MSLKKQNTQSVLGLGAWRTSALFVLASWAIAAVVILGIVALRSGGSVSAGAGNAFIQIESSKQGK